MLVVALLSAVSCSKQEQPVWSSDRIAFRAGGPGVDLDIRTRTVSETTASTLESSGFYVSAVTGSAGSESSVWNSVSFTKDGTYFEGDKYWPNSNPSYKFYASSLAITYAAAGSTVNASNTSDVVCSYMASPTYMSPNTFTFEHIFARIGDVTVSALDGYTITGVSVSITPKTGGVYNMRTGSGQSDGTGWSSLTTGSATNIANATPGTKSNDLYLVPGNYDIAFSWTASKGDYSANLSKTVTGVSIVGGKVNAVTVSLTGNAADLQFGVTITPWTGNTVAMGDVTPEEEQVYSFGGLEIAPGNLYYLDGEYRIPENWRYLDDVCDNNLYGNVDGSYFFEFCELGKYFDSRGSSFNYMTGSIDNMGQKVSFGGYDDWRIPTLSEWKLIFTRNSSERPGSVVNGYPNVHFSSVIVDDMRYGFFSKARGYLIFPDNKIFVGESLVYDYDSYEGMPLPTHLNNDELDAYLAQGCIFLPCASYYNGSDCNNFSGYYWSSNHMADYEDDIRENYDDEWSFIAYFFDIDEYYIDYGGTTSYESCLPVRLVRTIE